ncbi:uncharacterized protein LOC142341160 isoform X1 [Convolutriloba macropyga]|uniref:uncharacterized protein LOC142341160 isoform X1 n=1 Tax=Convolutriloba macropyga TaxID=536237 RepID=UPI003F522D9A
MLSYSYFIAILCLFQLTLSRNTYPQEDRSLAMLRLLTSKLENSLTDDDTWLDEIATYSPIEQDPVFFPEFLDSAFQQPDFEGSSRDFEREGGEPQYVGGDFSGSSAIISSSVFVMPEVKRDKDEELNAPKKDCLNRFQCKSSLGK